MPKSPDPPRRGRPRSPPPKPARRKSGSGSVRFHKPSGLYRATLPPRLDPKQRPHYEPTRELAVAWLDAELARLTTTTTAVSGAMTLGAYLRHYLAQEATSAQWSPRTLASQATNADYLRELFDRPLDSIVRADLQPIVARLQTDAPREFTHPNGTPYVRRKPLGPGALHNAVGLWRRAFGRAAEDELIARNPCQRLTLPPLRQQRAESWTPAEARRLVPRIAAHRFAGVYSLIFGAGLRIGEARGLAWADIDWANGRAWIWRQADGPRILERVKGRQGKWVTLIPPVVAILRASRARQGWDAEFISEWRPGVRVSRDTLVSDLKALAVEVGVRPFSPHAGRHAVGNVLGAARVPLSVISDRLRHRSRSVTADWYLESDEDGRQQADGILSALFGAESADCG